MLAYSFAYTRYNFIYFQNKIQHNELSTFNSFYFIFLLLSFKLIITVSSSQLISTFITPAEKHDDKRLTNSEIRFLSETIDTSPSNINSKKKHKGVSRDFDGDSTNDDYGMQDTSVDDGIIMDNNDETYIHRNHIDSNTNKDINFNTNEKVQVQNKHDLLKTLENIDDYIFSVKGDTNTDYDEGKDDMSDMESMKEHLWNMAQEMKENEADNESIPVGNKRNALISAMARRSRKVKDNKGDVVEFVPAISAGESHGRLNIIFLLCVSI